MIINLKAKARWATPHLLDILAMSASNLEESRNRSVFTPAAGALADVAYDEQGPDPNVVEVLTQYKNGVGLRGRMSSVADAREAAGRALQELHENARKARERRSR